MAAPQADGVRSAIVVDCGTFSLKAGYASKGRPTACVELPTPDAATNVALWRELLEKRLGATVSVHPVVLAVPISASFQARETLCRLIFDAFRPPALFIGSTAFLAALGAGLSTALVVDIGHSGSSAVLIDEGYPLAHCTLRCPVGGAFLTAEMARLMREAGLSLPEAAWPLAARAAKERLGRASADAKMIAQAASGRAPPVTCSLPGGATFTARRGEGNRCVELLFNPASRGEAPTEPVVSVQEIVIRSLRLLSDVNMRGRMLERILLVGGSSRFDGLQERLLLEVKRLSPWVAPGTKLDTISVLAPPDRDILAWQGAALLSECEVIRSLYTGREDFFKGAGTAAVHRNFM